MSKPSLFLQGMNIVLLGDFNPKIFQPAWFAAQNLIGEKEAELADVQVIMPDVVVCTMEWLRVQVTHERFQFSTEQEPYYELMRDLTIGTFTLLEHTPIHSLGINMDFHYKMPSIDSWHAFGHKLAPKPHWEGILKNPGLATLIMQGERTDNYTGYMRVSVAPSVKTKSTHGIHIGVNDHYQLPDINNVLGCGEIIKILKDTWIDSVNNAKSISSKLLEDA